MIKDILKTANRYEDVLQILDEIIDKNFLAWNHQTKIRKEAILYKEIILANNEVNQNYLLSTLLQYVKNYSDTLLHNYAINLTHRLIPDDNIDTIRAWLSLGCVINYLNTDYKDRYDLLEDYLIPEGWQKNENIIR